MQGTGKRRRTGGESTTPLLFTRTAGVSLIRNMAIAAPQLSMGRLLVTPPRKESAMMWRVRALLDDRPGAMAALA
jgi:hypothetical protein